METVFRLTRIWMTFGDQISEYDDLLLISKYRQEKQNKGTYCR